MLHAPWQQHSHNFYLWKNQWQLYRVKWLLLSNSNKWIERSFLLCNIVWWIIQQNMEEKPNEFACLLLRRYSLWSQNILLDLWVLGKRTSRLQHVACIHYIFLSKQEKATDWNVKKLFSMYKIFNESPSSRAGNKQITCATSSDYPLNFCLYHWIENLNVAKQA